RAIWCVAGGPRRRPHHGNLQCGPATLAIRGPWGAWRAGSRRRPHGDGMDRRGFVVSAAAFAALAGSARAGIDGLRLAAREAWLYGLPLIEMARLRSRMIAGGALGRFVHTRELAGPHSRTAVVPEPGVLCSSAWLDL